MTKIFSGIVALMLAAAGFVAFQPNNETMLSEQKDVKVKPFATGAFLYISGHVDSASSYGTTTVNPNLLCQSGQRMCAATFQLDEAGNRTGNPQTPIWTKP